MEPTKTNSCKIKLLKMGSSQVVVRNKIVTGEDGD